MKRRCGALIVIVLLVAGPARAVTSDEAGWTTLAAANHAHARGRGVDQLANPDYNARFWPRVADFLTGLDPAQTQLAADPYRSDWAPARGTRTPFEFPNRYGATLQGSLWLPTLPFTDPVSGAATDGPLPAVVFVSGTNAPQVQYLGIVQGLAEAGYAVMSFDPQGQGVSDSEPEPRSIYCDPEGDWREPQEFGIAEEGACAGEVRSFGDGPLYEETFFVEQRIDGPDFEAFEPHYRRTQARFIFGAFDAISWLLSDANPHRSLIDATRVGIVGHSLGAHTALNVGNGDPLGRFSAAVALDTFGPLLEAVTPTVPTMLQYGDREEFFGPYPSPPDPASIPGERHVRTFADHGVDVASFVLRGSTHLEWAYTPNPLVNPVCRPPLCTASRKGERVGLYLTLAWLDRFLKGQETGSVRGDEALQRQDAQARLVAATIDDSVDGSSIGHGWWDATAGANVPYTIAGDRLARHLSRLYRSSYAFDEHVCGDWLLCLSSPSTP